MILPQFEAELLGGGLEHAHALGHHLLADAVARDDGDAINAIGGYGHGRFPFLAFGFFERGDRLAVKTRKRHRPPIRQTQGLSTVVADASIVVTALRATKNLRLAVLDQSNTEHLGQSAPPFGSEPHRTRVAHTRKPAALEAATADLRTDEARDVIAPLAPVEARPAINPATADLGRQRRAKAGQQTRAAVGELAAVVAQNDIAAGSQRAGDGDAYRARNMIVAGAGEAQRLVGGGPRLMPRRDLDRGHRLDAFQHLRDQRRGDPIVSEAALARDGQKPCLDKLRQMLARGRPRHPGEESELGASERLAAHQRREHRGARGVAYERSDFDQIGGGNHGWLYRRRGETRKQRRFGARRTVYERQAWRQRVSLKPATPTRWRYP